MLIVNFPGYQEPLLGWYPDVVLLARKTPTEGVRSRRKKGSGDASERPQNGRNSFIHILFLSLHQSIEIYPTQQ
jgi:hypothetical protein